MPWSVGLTTQCSIGMRALGKACQVALLWKLLHCACDSLDEQASYRISSSVQQGHSGTEAFLQMNTTTGMVP